MDALKIGDAVLTRDGTYSKVYSFGHFAPETLTKYLQIHTLNNKTPLEISNNHLLYVFDGDKHTRVVAAGEVKVGDTLLMENGIPAQVDSIRRVTRSGAYAPLTGTGEFVVDGFVASSYVSRDWVKNMVSGQTLHLLQHGAAFPFRVFCGLFGCEDETYDESTGYSPWISFWFGLEQWQLRLSTTLQLAFLLFVVAPIALVAVFAGKLLTSPTAMLFHVAAALICYSAWQSIKEKKDPEETNNRSIKKKA